MEKYNPEVITSILTFRHDLNRLREYNYPYSIDVKDFEEIYISFDDAKSLVRDAILNSIDRNKTESPGVMMSGGIDSVLIASILKRYYPNLRCYTARFKGDNEYMLAQNAAKKLKLNHTVVDIYPEDYVNIEKYLIPLTKLKKEPLHPNEIALAKTESIAKRDGCDVVFCGEGADDIFGGYSKIFTYYKKHNVSTFLDFYRYFSLTDRNKIIKKEYLMDDNVILNKYIGDVKPHIFGGHFIQRIHTPGLIKRGINAIRFNGLKWSFPYIDRDLVKICNGLPIEYKNFGNISKYILRELSLQFIPREFSYSKKHPFPVPFDYWMKDITEWELDSNVFKHNNISKFNGWHKWMLINLNTWLEYE